MFSKKNLFTQLVQEPSNMLAVLSRAVELEPFHPSHPEKKLSVGNSYHSLVSTEFLVSEKEVA